VNPTDAVFLELQTALAGRYSLLGELGRGGMGIVYLAREVRLDRLVAIKVLPPSHATPVLRERFLREARTVAKLSHPGIVPIHAVDEAAEFVFIAMGYVDGESLSARVAARGRLPAPEAARILKDVAWALAYAHAQGVVHRDIKPDNILIERGTGRSLVADFGIAHVAEGSGITMAGQVLGTPEYMSPEQASGQEVDGRSDIYSLGAVGYFALSGRSPFTGPTVNAVLAQQITQPAEPVLAAAADVPPRLAQVVDRCLLKSPIERYASAEAVAEAIEAALASPQALPVPLDRWVHSVDQVRLPHVLLLPMLIYPVLTLLDFLLQTLSLRNTFFKDVIFNNWLTAVVAFVLPFVVYGIGRWRDVRAVLAQGCEIGDLRAALGTEMKRLTDADRTSVRLARRLWTAVPGVAIAGIGLTTVGECYGGSGSDSGMLLIGGWLALAGSLMIGRALRTETLPPEVLDLRARRSLWQGRLGDWLARLAGIGLRQTERPAVTHRPTEFALGSAAAAIFEALPREVRRELRDIPDAIHRLEARAQTLRARLDEIAGLEAAGGAGADRYTGVEVAGRREALRALLQERREQAERLLSEVVTALETVRIDLLRLRAGAVNPAGVSSDIALASAVGVEVDAALAGRQDVETLLRENADRPGPSEGRQEA
jgi:serine/threonine-protein kinase